ncbi:MAG: hypothetical protein K6G15_04190 [Desulfovibrio sp.]|nr:hypothetical protein [Desulfovibrio sp.]
MLLSYADQFKENTIKEREPVWKEEIVKLREPAWKEEVVKLRESVWKEEYKDSYEAKWILSSIHNFLDARFGSVSSNYENRLQSIKTFSELQAFNKEVYKVNNIKEFEGLLDKACSGNNS